MMCYGLFPSTGGGRHEVAFLSENQALKNFIGCPDIFPPATSHVTNVAKRDQCLSVCDASLSRSKTC